MCCMLTSLIFIGPRFAILVWWLISPVYVSAGFNENWLLTLLAWAFIPWTVLMYLIVYPGGIEIIRAEVQTSEDGAYALKLMYFTAADPPVFSEWIDTLNVGASDQRFASNTFDNSAIAVGQIIYMLTPATDIDWIRWSLTFYVKENN